MRKPSKPTKSGYLHTWFTLNTSKINRYKYM